MPQNANELEVKELQKKINSLKDILYIYQNRSYFHHYLADILGDGGLTCDEDGIILQLNYTLSSWLGVRREESIGQSINVLNDLLDIKLSEMITHKTSVFRMRATLQKTHKVVLISMRPIFTLGTDAATYHFIFQDLASIRLMENRIGVQQGEILSLSNRWNEERQIAPAICLTTVNLRNLINTVAPTDASVLITGETGTGKEVVATQIQKNSKRAHQPYIKINCSAFPKSLIESELFGYAPGAFTGASKKGKVGLFEAANHGTILLDEIGDMPLPTQAKLLRVLQENEIIRIGDTEPKKIDVRVIASTNANLPEKINRGEFRQDLFYRLNIIPIYIPPLRERTEDIPSLVNFFLLRFNNKYNETKIITIEAMEWLTRQPWPGNVRMLENIIERAVLLVSGREITAESLTQIIDLYSGAKKNTEPFEQSEIFSEYSSFAEATAAFEKRLLEDALQKHGNTYAAARALSMSQTTFWRKAKKLGVIDEMQSI